MFDYLAMSFKDADYTIVITLVCDKNVWILVLKLTLVVGLWMLLFSGWPPLLECPASTFICSILSGKANEDSDYTAIIAGVHWHLCAKTDAGGEVVSTVLASFWLPLLTRLKQHGHHMTCIVSLPHGIIWKAFDWGLNTSWAGGYKQSAHSFTRSKYNLLPRVWLPFQRRKNVSLTVGYNFMTEGWTLRWVYYEGKTNLCY